MRLVVKLHFNRRFLQATRLRSRIKGDCSKLRSPWYFATKSVILGHNSLACEAGVYRKSIDFIQYMTSYVFTSQIQHPL